jgi:hypothetical protein
MIPSPIELCSVIVAEFTTLGACYVRRINIHHPKAKTIVRILLYNAVYNCIYLYMYKSMMVDVPIIITEPNSAFVFQN